MINLIKEFKNLNGEKVYINSKILILFFILIFLLRFFFVYISHGNFPIEFSWHYLLTLNKFKINDFSSLIQHDENAQFQLFTDLLALILFKVAGNIWEVRFNTSLIQIIPSVYITIIIFLLFYKKKIPLFIVILIFIFSISFGSQNNIKHFTESHFYFQILFFSIGLLFLKKKVILIRDFIFIISLLLFSSLNMEKASFINYFAYLIIFLIRFFFEKNKLFLYYFFILLFFTVLTYFFILSLNVPSFSADPYYTFSYYKFLKTNIKILLHQNSIFFLIFLLFFLLTLKNKNYFKFYKNNSMFIFILIWCFILGLATSFSRGGVYNRYKDFIQIYGFLTFYLMINMNFLNYKLLFFLRSILLITCFFLFLNNLSKIINLYNFSKKNDNAVINLVKDYVDIGNKNLEFKNKNLKLFGELHRFQYNIYISLENKLINFF